MTGARLHAHSLIITFSRLLINTHMTICVCACVCVSIPSHHQDAPLSPKSPSPDFDSGPSSSKPPASVSTQLARSVCRSDPQGFCTDVRTIGQN